MSIRGTRVEPPSLRCGAQHQNSYTVECPHCGAFVEALCPNIAKAVRQVKTNKEWYFNFADSTNTKACSNCCETMTVYWYYKASS